MNDYATELADCTNTLLDFIGKKEVKRNDIATLYAMSLCSSEDVDYAAVNKAIMERWSISALEYIKKRAWKMIEERRAAAQEQDQ